MKNKGKAAICWLILYVLPSTVFAASPGGVSSDFNAWFKADAGISMDGGNNVTAWADQSGSGNHSTSVSSDPNWQPDLINGNPAVDFDGNDYINLPNGTVTSGTGGYTGFIVAAIDDANWHPIAAGGNEVSNQRFWIGASDIHRLTDAWWGGANDLHTADNTLTSGVYFLSSYTYNTSTGRTIYQNSLSLATDSSTSRNHGSGSNRIGARPNLSEIMNGRIAEIIIYDAFLSNADRQRVESYLAIKYGASLDNSVNYVDSAGATIYASTTQFSGYTNDIAGVGRDDTSALGQVKSASNSTDALITMEAENEGTNTTPAWIDIADREFLCWGNNNGNASVWTTLGAPANAVRLARVWRVSEPNGDVGLVTVTIQNTDLPGGIVGDVIIYTDSDNDFTSGAAAHSLTNLSGVWTGNIDFSNLAYFTIGYFTIPPTPTFTPTLSTTPTITLTRTPTDTVTPTPTPTVTRSETITPTPTVTLTPTPTDTPPGTYTQTMTLTASLTPTRSITFTATPTAIIIPPVVMTFTPGTAAQDLDNVQVFPNPYNSDFNHSNVVTFFNLPAQVIISIYSIEGKIVRVIRKNDGGNRATWPLTNQQGQAVSSGVYIYVMQSEGRQRKGKIALLR